jgi:uncharacterized repeat protein (TIGR03803 family)
MRRSKVLATILFTAAAVRAADNIKVLYGFENGNDGGGNWADLVFDAQGNLYGANKGAGAFSWGTVFKLTPGPNGKWTMSILHSFGNGPKDARSPQSRLIFDQAGNLWGTTLDGPTLGNGTVFELSPGPNGTWRETVFPLPGGFGGPAQAGLTFDQSGNLYGTMSTEVFRLTPDSNGHWKYATLCSFPPGNKGGQLVHSGLASDASGDLYGVTQTDGVTPNGGAGTVFKVTRGSNGAAWTCSTLFGFTWANGATPRAELVLDQSGNIYGTTEQGGASWAARPSPFVGAGTVFKLAPNGKGEWTETVLHSFNHRNGDGIAPHSRLIFDKAGNLYGTTVGGGAYRCGTVFKLTPSPSGEWTETLLHSFSPVGNEGAGPMAGLISDAQGNLYGTTGGGGGHFHGGMVYEVLAGSDK